MTLGYLFGANLVPFWCAFADLGLPFLVPFHGLCAVLVFQRPSWNSIDLLVIPSSFSCSRSSCASAMTSARAGGVGGKSAGAAPGPFVFRRSLVGQIWDNFSARPATFCALFSVFFTIEVREAEAFSQPVDPRWDRRIKCLSSTNAVFYSILKSLRVRSSLRFYFDFVSFTWPLMEAWNSFLRVPFSIN